MESWVEGAEARLTGNKTLQVMIALPDLSKAKRML